MSGHPRHVLLDRTVPLLHTVAVEVRSGFRLTGVRAGTAAPVEPPARATGGG